jgi:hypothetical protein
MLAVPMNFLSLTFTQLTLSLSCLARTEDAHLQKSLFSIIARRHRHHRASFESLMTILCTIIGIENRRPE